MTNSEKAAYIKGLIEGLDLDTESKEGKVLAAVSELLCDIANDLEDLDEFVDVLQGQVDEIDEDLGDVEEEVYDLDDDDDLWDDDDEDLWDEDDDEDDDWDEDDDDCWFEVTCPDCGDKIQLNADMLDEGSIDCPNCGLTLEFDLDDDEAEETEE